ncbi:MAG TPA: alpha-L-fucosidase [Phycisphaerae bacterium]|nr:alpha-L-fucosidase [Phycisphaerae bacterium]HOB74716.1 alpha-L-fucosidase [Phycisphaerae bacterium]HOJ56544.1 alpha-L-fucosidase [Phycisphaerae bacterium]HOL25239.1 alpha-L-fucosidase [Phycisphaerae bacterium]HPP22765.1 alpha-L-fucosidase [Phycisphaerae bacterium]
MRNPLFATVTIAALFPALAWGQAPSAGAPETQPAARTPGNKPERIAWFQTLGLGMFIHWSLDSQLGVVISHSMAAASPDYLERFITELPRSFNPRRFEPDRWAELARLAGMKYVVFTAKHHSGFCMFDTKTTDFSVMHTPYGQDITRQVLEAFRRQGLAIGLYFSPDDFWLLYRQGHEITRRRPEAYPVNNPQLMAHDKAQLRELLTNYGPIDLLFIDGPAEELRELCWELQPDIVVTRGAMETPEQELPGEPLRGPWEACWTMGEAWQYQPTNERYKSGTSLINTFIETRARGGNLLLNVGPHPDGFIPPEQEGRLRELAMWNFINRDAVFGIRPWHVTNEGPIWFTRAADADTVYAIVTGQPWPHGQWQTVTLKSVRATPASEIEILGQSGKVMEYKPDVVPKATWTQDDAGLHIKAMRAQRIYDDYKWPNPIVIRITHARGVNDE